MARRQSRVRAQLVSADEMVKPSEAELRCILRAADEIIMRAGRDMLAKILKGSKEKKVLGYGLDACPVYGCFHEYTLAEITKMIDWSIRAGYLAWDYDGRLPLIVFTQKGWELYKPIYAEELHQRILHTAEEKAVLALIEQLKKTNREVILLLLEDMATSKNIGILRFLEQWRQCEIQKVRSRIDWTITEIRRA